MATVKFLSPILMSTYPTTPSGGGGSFSPTQIGFTSGNVTGNFFGSFEGIGWSGTITQVVIGRGPFLELDITGFSFTTSNDVSDFGFNGIGNFLAELLAGNDTFIGTTGADGYVGYGGNDTVTYAAAATGIFAGLEEGGLGGAQGDTFSGIENLTGSNFSDTLYGNAEVNILKGGNGDDWLVGKGGGDRFEGGSGTDTVFYDASFPISGNFAIRADLLDPSSNQGDAAGDTYSSIENLEGSSFNDSLWGNNNDNIIRGNHYPGESGNDKLYGRGGDDRLFGNDGADTLNGGTGADEMRGGEGDDIYIVDNTGDDVFESANQGTDTVRSSVSFSLAGQNLEKLELTGSGNINGTGNSLANTITGNSKNNVVNGGIGADEMRGGAGNDTYIVDNAGDEVFEFTNRGTDTVRSSISFSLGEHLERLELTGSANIQGLGSSLANQITGNTGNNIINGREGNDILTGGGGADFFRFNTALNASTNVDTIADFQVNVDKIQLENAIFTAVGASLTADEFVANAAGTATDASQHILYDTTDGRLFYDADGNGGQAKVHFATLNAGLALDHLDFVVI